MFGLSIPQAMKREELGGEFDRVLLAVVVALASIGIVMVASSSLAVAEGHDVGPFFYLQRHLMFLAVGAVGAMVIARMELRYIERHGSTLLLLAVVLLGMVLVPGLGREVNGARRWLEFRFFGFQAVEAVKLLLIVWLSAYMVRYRDQLQERPWGVLKPLVVMCALSVFLLAQPDFGSTVLLCAITFGMLWLGGARLSHLLAPAVLGVAGLAALAIYEPYRMARLVGFINPWADPFGSGYQLTHALIAVGRGEFDGVGLGGSVQKLFYLPEAHTDFIFAVIAEETGFIGVVVLIGLFVLLAGRAFWLGMQATEMGRMFAANCAFGVGLWMSLQTLVSVGVNLGLLPTKGLTLPLISSGGSSVMMSCAAIGLLLRVSYETERARRQSGRLRGEDVLEPAELLGRSLAARDALQDGTGERAATAKPMSSPVFRPGPLNSREPVRTHARDGGRIEPKLGALP
ncbi:putative lipid II flippase FtsW [Aquimonas sp.]|jgi:cell division protein FtsW|uniref:putative lipid II flippase FtsW n=1 Tax=Aquimonas sp. TaxID=1872588 RepID=UPI0037BE99F6